MLVGACDIWTLGYILVPESCDLDQRVGIYAYWDTIVTVLHLLIWVVGTQ